MAHRAVTFLESLILTRAEWDPEEFALLMQVSEDLKEEGNLKGGGWQERPATLKQILAAGILLPEDAVLMSRAELRAVCQKHLRGTLADLLGLY